MFSKIIDKLLDPIEWLILKRLKINTNEFFTYIFGILIAYFTLDRVYEIFHMIFAGECVNYWTPLEYTLVLICVVCGYAIICASPLNITIKHALKFFVPYSICFYIICFAMTMQWINEAFWFVLMQFSNFRFIAENLPETIIPAVSAVSLIIPCMSLKSITSYYMDNIVDGDTDFIDSFEDYKGFKLQAAYTKKKLPSSFMCNATICIDDKTGTPAVIPEKKRFEAVFVEGATGTGKTATIVEPMCAGDIERKYFFRELSKKMGYHALKNNMAVLKGPYSNEYLNRNFTLSYLVPKSGSVNEYKNYVKDMIKYVDSETGEIYYRGIGLTVVAPDNACISRIQKVANAYSIDVNIIDPMDPNSYGINPFIGTDPAKVAAIISTVLKGMYEAETSGDNQFFQNVTQQAIENIAILLKLIYPKMHNGDIPTLEDMLTVFNNFDIAEEMCEVLKKDPALADEYTSLIGYFEKNFYKPPVNIHGYEIASSYGSGRKDTEKFVYGAITQLDNFLRNPGIKRVLCSRHNNIDLDKALAEGQLITACTRQGDLGEIHQKAFGMFVILSFKDAVLRRPGIEDTRTPHFIYIDEFPLYVNKDTEAFFTLFRKYRCGTLITVQNLSQLTKNKSLAYFKDVIITNTKTQIVFGDMTAEESVFWEKELGTKKKWDYRSKAVLDTSTEEGNKKQTEAFMGSKLEYVPYYKAGKIVSLPFKTCIYRTKTEGGKSIVGRGATDFINKKYYETHKCDEYDFEPYMELQPTGISSSAHAVKSPGLFKGDDGKKTTTSSSSDSSENVIDVTVDPTVINLRK